MIYQNNVYYELIQNIEKSYFLTKKKLYCKIPGIHGFFIFYQIFLNFLMFILDLSWNYFYNIIK